MSAGVPVDRDALHARLFERAGRGGRLILRQQELADEIGVNKFTMSRIVSDFVAEGRLKKIGSNYHNVGTYIVRAPSD